MGNPLISVVTAAYNARDALEYTVASVMHQTLPCEHIVIDGGSSDGTAEFLSTVPVKFVSEPDNGIAHALNKGLAMATGEYVIVLQAGDIFRPDSAEVAAPRLKTDLVSFNVLLVENGHERLRKARPFSALTRFKMTSPHQGLFVRRSLYERIGTFDETYRIAMDYEFLVRAMTNGASQTVVDEVIAAMPSGGISTQTDWPSVRTRLLEDRRLHLTHATGIWPAVYATFWPLYLRFKESKHC